MRGPLALLLLAALVSAGSVQLVNNGYEGLVVAISPDVDEANSLQIIDSIKRTVGEASDVLFTATRQRAFFRDVKILLPKTWTNTPFDEPALNQNFEDSDIRVDVRNVVYGDQPYTDQPGGCGQPGRYIHLTPEYLLQDAQAEWWGPRNKTLVHEWAKYRWGVFDEFGYPHDPTFPLFYWTTQVTADGVENVATPTYCANEDLTGTFRDIVSKGSCSYVNGFPNDNCRFLPDEVQTASSSLMAYYYVNSIVEFCDSESNEKFLHNDVAPNRHNLMCDGASVWDVIGRHHDFQGNANLPTTSSSPTKFTVLRQEAAKFALVLDYSGSMDDFQRIDKLQRTARRWILHEVAQGSYVGIVKFSTSATKVAGLTEITDDTSRTNLANLIDKSTGGYTSIGSGLSIAINDILANQFNPVILLISDGEENRSPFISDVKERVVSSGARVVTVAFGNAADPNLESLAEDTGGKTFTVMDEDSGGMLDDAFLGALTYQPGDQLSNTKVQIYEFQYSGTGDFSNGNFFVDSSMGRELEFRLYMNDTNTVTVKPSLRRPNGTLVDTAVLDSSSMWIINIPLAEEGNWRWTVTLSGNKNNHIRVGVTAKSRDSQTMPIYTRAWLNSNEDVNAAQDPVIIYAEVKQGNKPVVGAHVRAYVTQPLTTAAAIEVDLLDNGQGADTQAGDGIYSRYLTVYSSTGRYAVKAQVWDDGSAFINNGFTTSRKLHEGHPRALPAQPLDVPSYCCGSVVPFDPESATPTGSFTRSASGGSFRATSVPSGELDFLPPSRVTDLQTEVDGPNLILTWTATGDDYDAGIVSEYEIRLTSNRSALSDAQFETSGNETLLLSFKDSTDRTEIFVEAGLNVTLQIEVEEALELDEVYFVALKAKDDSGKVSRVSNIAPTVAHTPSGEPGLAAWEIVLIVIGCIVGVLAIAGGVFLAKKHFFD